jgi:hypothetical protein
MLVIVAANASIVSFAYGFLLSRMMAPPTLPEIVAILPG